MTSLPLAEFNSLHLIPIVAIVGGITLAGTIIVYGLKYAQRRQELWHETARIALEKGQPLPPLPKDMREETHPKRNNDYRAGLIMLATGGGLFLFFETFLPSLRFVAAIPGFIGIGLLIFAAMDSLVGHKEQTPTDRPPQS